MSEIGLAMEDDDKEDVENPDESSQYEEGCLCDMCQGNGWVYDEEDGGTMCCPECE